MSDRGSLDNLKQEIVENIYTNENQAVTGDLLQDVLIDAVDTMGVSVSQNIETGHIDITVGDETTPMPSLDEINAINGRWDNDSITIRGEQFPISNGIIIRQGKPIHLKLVFDSATTEDFSISFRQQDDTNIKNFNCAGGNTIYELDWMPNINYENAKIRLYTTEKELSYSISVTEVSFIESVEDNAEAIHTLVGKTSRVSLFSGSQSFTYNSTWGKYVAEFTFVNNLTKDTPATLYRISDCSLDGVVIFILDSNYNILNSFDGTEKDFVNISINQNAARIRVAADTDLGVAALNCVLGTYSSFIDYFISSMGLTYGGEIMPNTSFDKKKYDKFYLAKTAGRYSNISNDLVLAQKDVVFFYYDATNARWDYQFIEIGEISNEDIVRIKGKDFANGYYNSTTNRVNYHTSRAITPFVYACAGTKITNTSPVQIVIFNKAKVFVSAQSVTADNVTAIAQNCYLRFVVVTNEGQTDYSNFDDCVSVIAPNAYNEISRLRIQSSKFGDFERGYYKDDGTIGSHVNRAHTNRLFKVKKGDFVFVNSNDYMFKVYYLDESQSWLNLASDYCRPEYLYPQYNGYTTGQIKVIRDGYITIQLASMVSESMSDEEIAGFDDLIKIGHLDNDYYNDKARGINVTDILYKKPIFINTQAVVSQDGTFIGEDLWLFGETTEPIYVINPDTGAIISQKTQNIGHCSSVDYNDITDTLITTAERDNIVYLQLYSNPSAKSALQRTDEEYMEIDITSLMAYFGSWALHNWALCWGEDKNIVYIILGAKESETGIEACYSNEHIVYKVQLGMGTNDYSNGGLGVFVSGKNADEYNGTAKVIVTYQGNIYEGIDTLTSLDQRPYVQGMAYDGYLYVGWGIREHNFLKIKLDDNSKSLRAVANYQHKFFDNSDTQIYYEPEVTALRNGRIYCGSRNQNLNPNSVLLYFEL